MNSYDAARSSDLEQFRRWYLGLLEQGIYAAPSQFEAMFLCNAHTDEEIERIVACAGKIFDRFDENRRIEYSVRRFVFPARGVSEHKVLFALVAPSCLALVVGEVDDEVGVALVVHEENLLLGVASVVHEVP